tara:strand:- start:206 stop:487 length:282 start_codon:yes stop_codon:yes gene_type:complete
LASDRSTGALLLIIGVIGTLLYGWLLFFSGETMTTRILQLTAFLGVAVILAIIVWIGYTMATTPPPESLDIEEVPETAGSPETSAPEEPKSKK